MIARIWSGESPLWLLLLPLSWLYGLVSGTIRLLYRLGLKRAWRAPVPVVVVLGVARVKTSLKLKLLGPIPGAPSWCSRR